MKKIASLLVFLILFCHANGQHQKDARIVSEPTGRNMINPELMIPKQEPVYPRNPKGLTRENRQLPAIAERQHSSSFNIPESDETSRLDSMLRYDWNGNGLIIGDLYIPSYQCAKEVYTYDDSGNLLKTTQYSLDQQPGSYARKGKIEYAYDEWGNQIMEARYDWDEAGPDWAGSNKYEYAFDAEGNQTLYASYVWSPSLGEWLGDRKYEHTYDANGNMLLRESYRGKITPGSWEWNMSGTVEYIYDENGNNTLTLFNRWDTTMNDWIGLWREEFTFDALGQCVLEIEYDWDTTLNNWRKSYDYEHSYDDQGNHILSLTHFWDTAANEWIAHRKWEHEYDPEGYETMEAIYFWDTAIVEWVGYYKYDYDYNPFGAYTSEIRYAWDATAKDWEYDWKRDHTYDAEGSVTLEVMRDWDQAGGAWMDLWKYEYFYDAYGGQVMQTYYQWIEASGEWLFLWKELGFRTMDGLSTLECHAAPDSLNMEADAGSKTTFEITSNIHWEISGLDPWLNASDSSGTGNGTITLSAGENTSPAYRTDTLTLSADGVGDQAIVVVQKARMVLTVSHTSLTLGYEASSTSSFDIASNTNWSVSGLEAWLSASESSGTGDATITLTADENASAEPRTDTITVSGTGVDERMIVVIQNGAPIGLSDQHSPDIRIYPNPADQLLHIERLRGLTTGCICTIGGQMILTVEIAAENGSINVSPLPSGFYILKLQCDHEMVVNRFIKE